MRVTCVLNACQTHSERGSDACVIELVAGLYRIIITPLLPVSITYFHAFSAGHIIMPNNAKNVWMIRMYSTAQMQSHS